jgi:hypothetical protein
LLCRYLLEGEGGNVDTFARVLDGDATDFAFSINVQNSVLVEVASFHNLGRSKFDVQRIGVLKVLNLHGSKDLSKKALWTGFTIWQEYDSQIPPIHFWNLGPSTDTTVGLNDFSYWMVNGSLNPFQFDEGSIRSLPHLLEVARRFHDIALLAWTSQSSVSA